MTDRIQTYNQSILNTTIELMQQDSKVVIIGEGVTDPKGIFGTTIGLKEQFGNERVLESPISENAVTGLCLGLSLSGFTPIHVHQRVDFSLYAFDQLINNFAKWNDMFGRSKPLPYICRMIIGQGWGQGPQHSQNLQNIFASFPGLNVFTPATANDVRHALLSAYGSRRPSILLEHRWCQHTRGLITADKKNIEDQHIKRTHQGNDCTIISSLNLSLEVTYLSYLLDQKDIKCDAFSIQKPQQALSPELIQSVQQTKNLLIVEGNWPGFSLSDQILVSLFKSGIELSKLDVCVLQHPYANSPSASILANRYFITPYDILKRILKLTGREHHYDEIAPHIPERPLDQPNQFNQFIFDQDLPC